MFLGIDYNDWQVFGVIVSSLVSTAAFLWTLYESRKNSKESRILIEESMRGYVSVYSNTLIANSPFKSYLIIKNIGKSPLKITDIIVDEVTKRNLKLGDKDFFTYLPGTSLAPDQSATINLNTSKFDKDHVSSIEIHYQSIGKDYIESQEINLIILSKLPSIGIKETNSRDTNNQLVYYLKQLIELYQDDLRKKL